MILTSWLSSLRSFRRRHRTGLRRDRRNKSAGLVSRGPSDLANHAELLEDRALLSTLSNGNEFHAGTGDVLSVDLSAIVPNAQTFTLTGFGIPAENETLTQTPLATLPSTFELIAGGESAGRLFLSDVFDGQPFATSGRFAFAPSLHDQLSFDSSASSTGFQGTVQVGFTAVINGVSQLRTAKLVVGPGYSTRTATASSGDDPVTFEHTTLNQLRLEQRLAYLGLPDSAGRLPDVDGQPDGFTESALRLFQSVVDPNGKTLPNDPAALGLSPSAFSQASGKLDGLTVAWLNHPDAPRWKKLVPTPQGTEAFAASWLVDAISQVPNANSVVITGLSNVDSISSSNTRNNTFPGRLHTAGIELDIDVPLAAQTFDGDFNDSEEQVLGSFVAALKSQAAMHGPHGGIRIQQVVAYNDDLLKYLNENVFGTQSNPGSVAIKDDKRPETLFVSFAAPTLPARLASEMQDGLSSLGQAFADLGTSLETFEVLAKPLPLIGSNSPNDPAPTIGNLLDIGSLLQEDIATRINNYFALPGGDATPTASELLGAFGGGLFSDLSLVTDSHDRAEIRLKYKQNRQDSRPLDFGTALADNGVLLDATATINLEATISLDVTFGVDLSLGLSPQQASFLRVQKFDVSAKADLIDLDLGGRIGFLGASVKDGSVHLTANAGLKIDAGNEVSLSQLQSTPLANLVQVTGLGGEGLPGGTVKDTTLPIQASLGTFSATSPITISDADVFDGALPTFDFSQLPTDLTAFNVLTPAGLNGVLATVRDFFGTAQASPLFDAVIPFSQGTKLGQAFDFAKAFQLAVTSKLESQPNQSAYTTAQELVGLLGPAITNVTVTPASGGNPPVLRLTFDTSRTFNPITGKLNLGLLSSDQSGLADITTSSTTTLTPGVEMKFTLAVELEAPGKDSTLSLTSPLSTILDANRWNAVRNDKLASDVLVTLRNGQTFGVKLGDLDAKNEGNTLQTIVDRFNLAAKAAVPGTMSFVTFDGTAKRLVFTDPTLPVGPNPQFKIASTNGSLVGMLLGLFGQDANGQGVIQGPPLHGDSTANHVFVENATLKGTATLAVPDIVADAKFGGLIDLHITNGFGSIMAGVELGLTDPTQSTPLTITDLVSQFPKLGKGSTLLSVTPSAVAELNLPISVSTDLGSLDLSNNSSLVGTNPSIAVKWPNVFTVDPQSHDINVDLNSLDVTLPNFGKLTNFQDLSADNISSLLKSLADFVDQLSGLDIFATDIPLIDRSLKDLLGFSDKLRSTINQFKTDKLLGLHQLEEQLKTALGPQFSMLDLSLDLSGPLPVLKFDLPFDLGDYSKQLPLDFDLSQLGVPGLADLADLKTAGQLLVTADAKIDLVAGIELTANGPRPFLYDSSHASATAKIGASNVQFDAVLGPFGVKIGKAGDLGSVVLDKDGNGSSTDPAEFTVSLTDGNGDGRHYFGDDDEPILADLKTELMGAAAAKLPIYTTLGAQLDLGMKNLEVKINDISDPVDTFQVIAKPDFAKVLSNLDFLGGIDNISGLIEGLDSLLALLENALGSSAFGSNLPLVGDKFKDQFDSLRELRETVVDNLRSLVDTNGMPADLPAGGQAIKDVQQAVFDALGPGNLNWLRDLNNDKAVTRDDVVLRAFQKDDNTGAVLTDLSKQIKMDTDAIQFELRLGAPPANKDVPIDFDLGIPGLGLDVDGKLQLNFGFTFDLTFGISRTDGVYFGVANANELKVDFGASFVDLNAQGELGFLQIDVTQMTKDELNKSQTLPPKSGDLFPMGQYPTNEISRSQIKIGPDGNKETIEALNALKGAFRIDISDPGKDKDNDGRLSLSELGSLSSSNITVNLGAVASLHWNLLASLGGDSNFPSIGSEFHAYWRFNDLDELKKEVPDPVIEFRDTRLNMGEFFNDFFGGALKEINEIIDPIRPIVDFLTAPIPVLSDLAGSPVTPTDLIRLYGIGGETLPKFIEAVKTVSDLAALAKVGNVFLPLGGFIVTFDGKGPHICPDPIAKGFSLSTALNSVASQTGTKEILDFFGAIPKTDGGNSPTDDCPPPAGFPGSAANEPEGEESPPPAANLKEGKFDFPLLDNPLMAFELLLGREDISLVTYDMPPLVTETTFKYFIPLPIFPPLGVALSGTLVFKIDFAFGFDTQGFFDFSRSGDAVDIFNGFYVSDNPTNGLGTGPDLPELEFYGNVKAAAELNLAAVNAGVGGGISMTLGFDLHDNNGDGKVRIPEIIENALLPPGLIHIFDVGGKIDAFAEAYVEALGIKKTFPIADVTLLNYELPRPEPTPEDNPKLGTLADGLLAINIGPRSKIRTGNANADPDDGKDDVISIRHGDNPNQVIVSGFGQTQVYSDVKSLFVDGGAGNDMISVERAIELPATILGGNGNDLLVAGNGDTSLEGGAGNDKLTANDGNDVLVGGDDDDQIIGGSGDDVILAGAGQDKADGGFGDDNIDGGSGNDELIGGSGVDVLSGGDDADKLIGGNGSDQLNGGAGNDVLNAGDGQDTASGGDGDDVITGGIGNDLLNGDSGKDFLDAGPGNDVVNGGNDNDELYGGLGSDWADGGAGNDLIFAGLAPHPGEPNSLYGGEPESLHVLNGGPGADTIHGDLGNDQIDAGADDNVVFAYAGNDIVTAGAGNDFIDTSAAVVPKQINLLDDDVIHAGDGNNTVLGGRGSETVTAGTGHDIIDLHNSATPTDTLTTHVVMSGAGNNLIHTDQGPDSITSLEGDDIVFSFDGGDVIDVGAGHDQVTSGAGHDVIQAGLGNDIVLSGGGDDQIDANDGDDLVQAGTGKDTVLGKGGNDCVSGESGDDDLFLGDGNDVAMGGAGDDFIVGANGHDLLDGDAGNDVMWGGTAVFGRSRFELSDASLFIVPPDFAAFDLLNPSGYAPPLIVPKETGGSSIDGVPDDGEDTINGGADTDWMFGGGMTDDLRGGSGDDYIDGGVGPELIHGDSGDDVVLGGGNDDNLFGDEGIDQLYGGDGNDILRGGAGVTVTADTLNPRFSQANAPEAFPTSGSAHVLNGQRSYGGDGSDEFYAYAHTIDSAKESVFRGEEMHGGSGNDYFYGNIRREVMSGGPGNDYLHGEYLIGPTYAKNPLADTSGGSDTAYGDGGEDQIYGGGGADVIFGGADTDFIEGQDGRDSMFGGEGIDFLKLDTAANFTQLGDVFDGHFGNRTKGDAKDDNATDILLIEGSSFSDQILLSEPDVGITSAQDLSPMLVLDGVPSVPAVFTLTVGGTNVGPVSVNGDGNTSLDDLVVDFNTALNPALMNAGFDAGEVHAVRIGNRIRLETNGLGHDAKLSFAMLDTVMTGQLKFATTQFGVPLLNVDYKAGSNIKMIRAGWRSDTGTPLVEQIRISGLLGDDEIGFVPGEDAVDFGDLSERSRDWVGVLDGGSGNDILNGSNARDRMDGGRGSDVLYGNAGDDRLFGDPGNGAPSDVDVLFSGAGNDDLIGGKGTNRLYAWSFDPSGPLHFDGEQTATKVGMSTTLTAFARQSRNGQLFHDVRFSLSTDAADSFDAGSFFDVFLSATATVNNTSLDDLVADLQSAVNAAMAAGGLSTNVTVGSDANGRLTFSTTAASLTLRGDQFGVFVDPATGLRVDTNGTLQSPAAVGSPFALEDTGLNRMLGSEHPDGDKLYGGTGLDFLYGNGGADELYTRDGALFETGFDVPAGDEWKAYAKATNKVWYYGGTDLDDVITVDYVTEPGLLSDHHLITRLTNNNGHFSFDAQVRLDFNATDDNGNLIWDANDVVESLDAILQLDPNERQLAYDQLALTGGLLPSEGDFLAIIIDALGGNDQVLVGPTVQRTVWVDGGAGDDRIEFQPGTAILVDQTENRNRNEVLGSELTDPSRAFELFGPTLLLASEAGPSNGQLSMPSRFDLSLDGGLTSTTIKLVPVLTNTDFDALVTNINAELMAKGLDGAVEAINVSGRLALRHKQPKHDSSLLIVSTNGTARDELHLADGQFTTAQQIAASTRFQRLTLDNLNDVDWYSFQFVTAPATGSQIAVQSLSAADNLKIDLFAQNNDGTLIGPIRSNSTPPLGPDLTERLLVAARPMPDNGQLATDVVFTLSVTQDGATTDLTVIVSRAATFGNLDADALVLDVQAAINAAAQTAVPQAVNQNGHLAFTLPSGTTGLSINFNPAVGADLLGFAATQTLGENANAFPLDRLANIGRVVGGTLHQAADEDVFRFSVNAATVEQGGGLLTVELSDPTANVSVEVRDSEGTSIVSRTVGNNTKKSITLDLTKLAEGEYELRLKLANPVDNGTLTAYSLIGGNSAAAGTQINLAGLGQIGLNLSGPGTPIEAGQTYFIRVRSLNRAPTVYDLTLNLGDGAKPVDFDLGARQDLVRRDVLIGGEGNDALIGGPSEDWIFGGAGNDILSGGLDRQNSDLIFGGSGDDLFQILPDDLPTNPQGEPLLTTQSDRLDGGPGFDQVLFVGGELDRISRPVPDHVAIRFNRFLQRYEFTSLVWDIANQEFVTEALDLRAVIESTQVALPDGTLINGVPTNGVLSDDATFGVKIKKDATEYTVVTIPKTATQDNHNLFDLAADINAALKIVDLGDAVVAEVTTRGLQLATTAFGDAAYLSLDVAANSVAAKELRLETATASGDNVQAFKQRYAWYEVLNVEGTRIETRAGDDEVHADPEYRFPLANVAGFLSSEWGIKQGNFQEGASIGALVIDGGDGNDRMFGGFLGDTIFGGEGSDFIAGREGDDKLDGGSGRDLILGESGVPFDRFEAITRDATSMIGDETSFNDSLLFSSLISPIDPSTGRLNELANLTFNTGDAGDWYLIPTPPAQQRFGSADRAVLSHDDITVMFDNTDDDALFSRAEFKTGNQSHNYSLFAAVQTDPQGQLAFLPVERFSGVPEFYLLHVNNVKAYGVRGLEVPQVPAGGATVQFSLTIDGSKSETVVVALTDDDDPESILLKLKSAFSSTKLSQTQSKTTPKLSDSAFAYLDSTKPFLVISLKKPGELQIHSDSGPLDALGFENGQTNRARSMRWGRTE